MIWIRKQELSNGGCGVTEMPKTPAKKEFENMLELLRDAEKFNNLGENDISASILTKLREYIENYTAKITLLLVMSLSLFSCSTAWHYNKIERKDPNFWSQFNDTIQMPFVTYDTIFHDGDTIAIIQRIEYRDTVIQTRMINPKSRFDYKSEALQLRHALKMEKEQTKQLKEDNKTLRTQSRTERTDIRQTNRTERTETRKKHRCARTFLFCLISFVVGCLIGMAFMFKQRTNVLRWLTGH